MAATATSTAAASEKTEGAAEVASTKDGGVASTEGGDGDNTAAPGAPAAKKKAKKVVEPGEKKKVLPNAYNIFLKEKIPEVQLKYPDMENKDVMREAAKEWKQLKQNTPKV